MEEKMYDALFEHIHPSSGLPNYSEKLFLLSLHDVRSKHETKRRPKLKKSEINAMKDVIWNVFLANISFDRFDR